MHHGKTKEKVLALFNPEIYYAKENTMRNHSNVKRFTDSLETASADEMSWYRHLKAYCGEHFPFFYCKKKTIAQKLSINIWTNVQKSQLHKRE